MRYDVRSMAKHLHLNKRLRPVYSYWGIVGVLFLIGVVLEDTIGNGYLTGLDVQILKYVLVAGAAVRLTRPGSFLLKVFLIIFLFVVVFSAGLGTGIK